MSKAGVARSVWPGVEFADSESLNSFCRSSLNRCLNLLRGQLARWSPADQDFPLKSSIVIAPVAQPSAKMGSSKLLHSTDSCSPPLRVQLNLNASHARNLRRTS